MIVTRSRKTGEWWRWDGVTLNWYGIKREDVPEWAAVVDEVELSYIYREWRNTVTHPKEGYR